MKPIEKGCRAVIINSRVNKGAVVTVLGNYNGRLDVWYIDIELNLGYGQTQNWINEYHLQRIDDDQELSSWRQVEEDTGWNPTKIIA